ncbi:hypothetical protein DE146DRAFT_366050 [Phaeosphaeria sp. MPI-PUGE-AT-0046c]|nr:hypothetical protein DE146DRAFT_366050 [Phaeosphaeria sp. MPI-PUGE-AT-0046c]
MPQNQEQNLALLLLPDPPVRLADLAEIRAALYPPLSAAVSFLNRKGSPAVLEVALPILRLVHVFREHRSLFTNVSVLLRNVYSLLSTIYQEIGLDVRGSALIDTRVMLVLDYESPFGDPDELPCGTVRFRTLATCDRPWNRVFVVDGEIGEARFKNFRITAAEVRPHWTFERVRIPGGLHFRMPVKPSDSAPGSSTITEDTLNQNTMICIHPNTFDFTDKYTLTMGLFTVRLIRSYSTDSIVESRQAEESRIYVATVKGKARSDVEEDITQQKRVVDFLLTLLDFGDEKTLAKYASKADTLDASSALSSVEQRFRVQCFVSAWNRTRMVENNTITTMVVSRSMLSVAEDVNVVRREKGWEPLKLVQLEEASPTALAEVY